VEPQGDHGLPLCLPLRLPHGVSPTVSLSTLPRDDASPLSQHRKRPPRPWEPHARRPRSATDTRRSQRRPLATGETSARRGAGFRFRSSRPHCPTPYAKKVANRNGRDGFGWERSSRGRFATPAGFPRRDCGPYRGQHVRRSRLGVVHRSSASFLSPRAKPSVTIRNCSPRRTPLELTRRIIIIVIPSPLRAASPAHALFFFVFFFFFFARTLSSSSSSSSSHALFFFFVPPPTDAGPAARAPQALHRWTPPRCARPPPRPTPPRCRARSSSASHPPSTSTTCRTNQQTSHARRTRVPCYRPHRLHDAPSVHRHHTLRRFTRYALFCAKTLVGLG
jgi:hypothetical protein